MSKSLYLIFTLLLLAGCSKPDSEIAAEASSSAAKDVLERVAGSPLPRLHTKVVTEVGNPWYQVDASNGEVTISGNSSSAITYGAYHYLKEIAALSVSWEGKRIALPMSFPDYHGGKVTTPFSQISYLNVCAYGYTTPWWDWQRWQQEIDWMAIHGVNNPVAMEGQEYVWQQLWQEFGVSPEQLSHYFSGPAFAPWQRMGNIEGHQGPLPQQWIEKKHQLQLQILARMAELGMDPVVPAFSGYVPKQFKQLFPKAKIYEMPKWTGFAHETYWLDPADPLFNQVAKRFIELYTQAYGAHHYYLSDAFNEMLPPVDAANKDSQLADYGQRIYQSIQQVAPDATWVMQGWMFGADEAFWDPAAVAAFLSKVPTEKMQIHDIGNDRYHVWQRSNGFNQKPWIFGFIHNYGGSDPVYGGFSDYVSQLQTVLHSPQAGKLSGFGVFPEGLHSNSIVYEFLFDLPWQSAPDLNRWLHQYSINRYGKSSPALMSAWEDLLAGVYQVPYWSSRWWQGAGGAYLLMKRPTDTIGAFPGHPGDLKRLDQGIDKLLALAAEYQGSNLYLYDLIDLVKQSVSLHVDQQLQQTIAAYHGGDVLLAERLQSAISAQIQQLDLLLGYHQESLTSWLSDAANYGDTPELKAYYINNARLQITQWGGSKLKDYASKAWQGMYAGYYLPRWQLYFSLLRKAKSEGVPFDDNAAQQQLIDWEQQWIADPTIPELQRPAAPVEIIQDLMQRVRQPVL